MRFAVWIAAFCVLFSACTTPSVRMTGDDLEGQTFSRVGEVMDWSGCIEYEDASDSMPSTLDDRDALGLAVSFGTGGTFSVNVAVTAVKKVGPDLWAIVGADGLVVGAMQAV